MGGKRKHLETALDYLSKLGGVRCSSLYETSPVGYLHQDDFLNMVIELKTTLSPVSLLRSLLEIEQVCGRKRTIRFGPRTLDLDLLLYDNEYVCFRDLQVPHPRMWERAFVMVPLAELAPYRRGLGGQPVQTIADQVFREGEIRCVGRIW